MITATNLTKRYGDIVAVDDLSFEVRPGRVTGFLGSNGAGKSTTMRMILGLDAPTRGEARVDGKPYSALQSPLRHLGALLDAGAVEPGRTAAQHLHWLAVSNGIDRSRVARVLASVGLHSAADRRVGGFSLGMRQRLGIAAALLGDPRVLMFDEPANGLDPEGIIWLRATMRTLAAEGRAVFVSSHLMAEVAQTADHLIVINRGRLVADAAISDVLAEHAMHNVYVRADRPSDLADALTRRGGVVDLAGDGALIVRGLESAAIGAVAAAERVVLSELTPRQPSLEEAFFDLTNDHIHTNERELVSTGA